MTNRMAVILAAGKGTRMRSKLYKVMHPILNLPMIEYVMRAVESSGAKEIITVVGHGAETIQGALGDRSQFVLQAEQLGTGHAVLQAESVLGGRSGQTLVVYGDTPLLTGETLDAFFQHHSESGAAASVLTAMIDDPFGYGRIIRNPETGNVESIVEEKDATDAQRQIKEINSGIYIFDNSLLFELLGQVTNDNAQGEYYLPDVIGLLNEQNQVISAYQLPSADEVYGINDRVALAKATQIMQQRINLSHMTNGVTLQDPQTTYIDLDVEIEPDVVIEPNVQLKGQTKIGTGTFIGSHSEIVDSQIHSNVHIRQSFIESSVVGEHVAIGPFAHLRPDSQLEDHVKIGNFVEVKNATVGQHTQAGHLAYIGDVDVGSRVNIGAGTIFVNYDGVNKHRSFVGDDAFIGCNASIIAPVEVAERATIAAGSQITKNVQAEALAITRTSQKNIDRYYRRYKHK